MTKKQLPTPKYYYGLDGNIRDEKNIYETKTMPKEDVDELFYDEKHLGSNSLMDLLNDLNEENEQLKQSVKRQQSSNEECSRYIEEVQKENEQLKHSIKCLEADKMELQQYIKRMQGDVE